ncbi:MAG: SPFH domain-containing protein [bacterium]|nr:SPFH domain-containing protein [bacterium]
MLGINYLKFDPMNYVMYFRNGKLVKEGKGLSFFYLNRNSSIVSIPLNSQDIPFIFNVLTNDYQKVSIQGQITFVIVDPNKISELLDLTVNRFKSYLSDDIDKLSQRIINEAQSIVGSFVQKESVISVLTLRNDLDKELYESLKKSKIINSLGLEILGVSVLGINADPEMQRALEAKTRESLQQDADKAIYDRRNFAVEQERKIKESELNTEIAVEEKQKQIAEKKMETDLTLHENENQLRQLQMESDLELETKNSRLVKLKTKNMKQEADARGYQLESEIKAFRDVDWKVISALYTNNSDPKNNIAMAFRELASNHNKINNLNISPDLIQNLLTQES